MSTLINAEHPYYATEGCYYSNDDVHTVIDSWAEFAAPGGWAFSDPDLNLLYRWDWWVPDADDLELVADSDEDESWCVPTLKLYFMLQRKAKPFSVYVRNVTPEDEPAIRAWLTERAGTIAAIWAPIAVVADASGASS